MLSYELFDQWIAALQGGDFVWFKGDYFKGRGELYDYDYGDPAVQAQIVQCKERCAIGVLARITDLDRRVVGIARLEGWLIPHHTVNTLIELSDSRGYEAVVQWLLDHKDEVCNGSVEQAARGDALSVLSELC